MMIYYRIFIVLFCSNISANPLLKSFFSKDSKIETKEFSPFLQYNLKELKSISHYGHSFCKNPKYFIEAANIEESKPENKDKIILYHGETYGSWIFQMILKAFMFPKAKEDWLPLRFEPLKKDIDKTDLLKMVRSNRFDTEEKYTEIGLSVSANLFSNAYQESAWHIICGPKVYWNRIAGLSHNDKSKLHNKLYLFLKETFIEKNKWPIFDAQKRLINKFIQIKRNLYPYYSIDSFNEKIETNFPKTYKKFKSKFISSRKPLDHDDPNRINNEGVVLQIIMDKSLANDLTYFSHPYGLVRSLKNKKFKHVNPFTGPFWNNDEIEPYSELYQQFKNSNKEEQARLALNKDFRSFPSRVRIKSIAGIMENNEDFDILKSMIKEMVEVNENEKVSKYSKFLDYFKLRH